MNSVVLDASVLVDALIGRDRADRLGSAVGTDAVIAPAHAKAEAMSAIGRLYRAGMYSEARATEAITSLASLHLATVPVDDLLMEAWALRHNLRLQDALYVALARRERARLLTVDHGLVAAAPDVARLPEAG